MDSMFSLRPHCTVLLGCMQLSACVDPDGSLEDYNTRFAAIYGTGEAVGGGGPVETEIARCAELTETCDPVTAEGLTGKYLFSLAAHVNPPKPVLLVFEQTAVADGEDITLNINISSGVDAKDRQTLAGDPIAGGPYTIAKDGSFEIELPTLTYPGSVNPITGTNLEAKGVTLHGVVCGPGDFWAGAVTGNVTKPIPVDLGAPPAGKTISTFTLQKYEGDVLPEPLINCDKEPAGALK